MDYATTLPPLTEGKNWKEVDWEMVREYLRYLGETIFPSPMVRNKIFNEIEQANIDRKNHRVITERLHTALIEQHINGDKTLYAEDVTDYAEQAIQLATVFDSTYKKHHVTLLDFRDFVNAQKMTYEERGLGTMRYETEKQRRNDHATMTYRHYESMICTRIKNLPSLAISDEEAEEFVQRAGQIATSLQEHYEAIYPMLTLEELEAAVQEMEVA
jgi:hypothetical protein